jgi:hypothetical protein
MQTREVEFCGHAAIEIAEHGARLVIVHDIGPRIAWFGRDDNVLFWDEAEAHRRGEWKLYGGHRFWLTRPGADESEETYAPDNKPCAVRTTARSVFVTAPIGALAIEKTLVVSSSDDGFVIEHHLRNRGDMLWSGGAWALTCTRPGSSTSYRVPLGGGSPAWDATTLVIPTRWGGIHTSRLDDPQFELSADALIVRPRGIEAKRMIGAPRGSLEMIDPERGTFRKRAAYDPHSAYPLSTNLALYIGDDNFMVELETMSPMLTLAPDETLVHAEAWALV